jgi:hypothetical protein
VGYKIQIKKHVWREKVCFSAQMETAEEWCERKFIFNFISMFCLQQIIIRASLLLLLG